MLKIIKHQTSPLQVEDIPDQPPEWISVPAVTRIQEDVPLFTPVGSSGSGSGSVTSKLYYKHVGRFDTSWASLLCRNISLLSLANLSNRPCPTLENISNVLSHLFWEAVRPVQSEDNIWQFLKSELDFSPWRITSISISVDKKCSWVSDRFLTFQLLMSTHQPLFEQTHKVIILFAKNQTVIIRQ